MAVEVKVDAIVTDIKKGVSSKGEYAFGAIKAEKGFDKISVFAENPQDFAEDTTVATIVSIGSVKYEKKEYPKGSGKWYPNVTVTAKLAPATAEGAKPIVDNPYDEIDLPF